MVFQDLQAIIPDQFKQVANRKLYLVGGGVIVLLMVCCLSLSVIILVHQGGAAPQEGRAAAAQNLRKHFCLTPACLRASSRVLDNMDFRTPPCGDFHRYSCGNWARANGLPPDHPARTTWSDMYDRNEERMREIIDSPIRHDTPDSAERKLKVFFRSCVHDYGRMRDAGASIARVINDKLHGWYAFDPRAFAASAWDFNEALFQMTSELLVPALFRVRVVYDWQGSRGSRYRKNMAGITQGGTGLGFSYYHREDRSGVRDAYQDMMREMAVLLLRDANVTLDASERADRVEQFVTDAYGVENSLANLMKQARRMRGYWRSARVTVGQLNRNMTQIKWRQLMNGYFEHADMTSRTKVRVSYFKYFGLMEQWLQNVTQDADTFKRQMNNYMVWRFLDTYGPYLSWEYKHSGYRLYETMYGMTEFPPTWESCLDLARDRLGSIVSGEYMRKHVSKEAIQRIEEMAKYTKEALQETLDEISWMDNITQANAKDKLDSIEVHVAFNDDFVNDDYLDDLHQQVQVSWDNSFFQNLMNLNAYQKVLHARALSAGQAYYMWRSYVAGVSSIYPSLYWRSNQLVIPMGSIQSPIYDHTAPVFYNFGSMGGYMGELMVKAIGEMGRYVWTNGTFANWWTGDTYKAYQQERDCMTQHFNNITLSFMVDGRNRSVALNGRYQAWQAIDDMAGIKAAFKGYKKWVSVNGPETMPAGMNMTVDQGYFIALTQMRCYIRRPENKFMRARAYRIPEDLMINSALMHSTVFQDTFQCKPQDKMAPQDTCDVY